MAFSISPLQTGLFNSVKCQGDWHLLGWPVTMGSFLAPLMKESHASNHPCSIWRFTIAASQCEGKILPLSLHFGTDVPRHVQCRMSYAFRVFAAIYGHAVVENDSAAAVRCFYAQTPSSENETQLFHIPALYQDHRTENEPLGFKKHHFGGEDFCLSFGIDPDSERPDWLGELFLWLSGEYESNIKVRDSIGRIPYVETVFNREGISPLRPHASLLMTWLESAITNGNGARSLCRAPSPVSSTEHVVVCSHDIDYHYTHQASALLRVIKNLGIAVLARQPKAHFFETLRLLFQAAGGRRVGHYVPALLKENHQCDIQSTFFAVGRQAHRRDPNYRLAQIAPFLRDAAAGGFSVGLHGSYRSVIEDHSLAEEAQLLAKSVGRRPLSGRQHWLRFSRYQDLFDEVARAGLLADSSLGFPDMIGFRNGASFAFPPYDFASEAPFCFLEIPLVLMDGGLEAASRQFHQPAAQLAEAVLEESRARGWGGIAILWHNPLEPLSVPTEINEVYWQCAARQKRLSEKWMSVDQFLAAALPRFQNAGLLQEVTIDC